MKLSEQITGAQEDQVAKYKEFINQLNRVQELYFDELKEKIGIRGGKEEEYLFDYVYNSGGEESFAEYLMKMNS